MLKAVTAFLLAAINVSMVSAQVPQSASDLLDKGKNLKEEKKYNEALHSFKEALAQNPDLVDALYESGWCLNELGEYNSAVPYLKRALAIDSTTARIHFELGYSYYNLSDTRLAREQFMTTLLLSPQYFDAAKFLGDIYFDEQDNEAAFATYKSYLQDNDAADPYYYYKAAWCLNELERYEEALAYLGNYNPGENDEIAKKYTEAGYAYYKLGENDSAIGAYEKALTAKPHDGSALRGLGDVYYNNTDEYENAVRYFNEALQYDEENSRNCYYKLGWMYNEDERYDQAVEVLRLAVKYFDTDAGNREELGYAFYMQQKYDSAMEQLDKAIQFDPQSKLGYYYKGLCYVALNQTTLAMDMYERLKPIDADQAEKLLNAITTR